MDTPQKAQLRDSYMALKVAEEALKEIAGDSIMQHGSYIQLSQEQAKIAGQALSQMKIILEHTR